LTDSYIFRIEFMGLLAKREFRIYILAHFIVEKKILNF